MTHRLASCHMPRTSRALSVLVLAFFLLAGCAPEVKVPEKFTHWNSKDGSFALNYPEGWDSVGGGSRSSGLAWAEFKSGGYKVRIDANFNDSMKADAYNSSPMGSAMLDGKHAPEFDSAEAAIQAFWKEHYEEEYSEYKEQKGEAFRTKLGATVMNRFSAKSGMTKIIGIRATTLSNDRSITFFAYCPGNKWKTFLPIYEKMLKEMTLGKEEMN